MAESLWTVLVQLMENIDAWHEQTLSSNAEEYQISLIVVITNLMIDGPIDHNFSVHE